MTYQIERLTYAALGKDRLTIKSFATSQAMHHFLNEGGNALVWKESTRGFKPGTYAYAGGKWHNTKTLDAMTLAHI